MNSVTLQDFFMTCERHTETELMVNQDSRDAHLAVEELSVDSACSSDSAASAGAGSGSGFRIRKKRKQPTRLITVREMNTV